MALDTEENRLKLIDIFPSLAGDTNFKILSEQSHIYSCIAWAMGYTDRWVDIFDIPGHWWPSGVDRVATPDALIAAFMAVGFVKASDDKPEENYRKVILYMNFETNEWTHASLVVTAQIEHSKFGETWDGHHSHNTLSYYGEPYAYMKRLESPLEYQTIPGTITVDKEKLVYLKKILKDLN